MARINIESCWWTDPRRERLGTLLGSMLLADAVVIRAWKIAQEFWGNDRGLVPKHVFATLEAHEKLVEAQLVEERDNGFYIRGSSQYLDWIHEKREAARRGGEKSVAARRKKHGTAQPKRPKSSKQRRSTPEPNSKCLEPSGSGSSSGSISDSKAAAEEGQRQRDSEPISINRKPPPGYEGFADRYDPEKQEVVDNSLAVINSLLDTKASPRIKKLIPNMLREVGWDITEFCVIAARLQIQFDDRITRGMPTPLAYREVAIKREFGVMEVSA